MESCRHAFSDINGSQILTFFGCYEVWVADMRQGVQKCKAWVIKGKETITWDSTDNNFMLNRI